MNQVLENPAAATAPAITAPYSVGNFGKGESKGVISSQWYSRPDDQRFTSLAALEDHVFSAAEQSRSTVIDTRDIRVKAEGADKLLLQMPDSGEFAEPNHWSFGQVASLVGAPPGYLRKLPAQIAGIALQYGLASHREEAVKAYIRKDGSHELRAATGPDYGRIYDHEVVTAVRKIAGNGTGDTCWKIPGVLDWSTMKYDPMAPVTKQSTTLFASDRDVFLFLVDDTHPIEIGKLPNGDPDLIFRGFYAWNSEVGSKAAGLATFYMRAICQNRILWGVENFQELKIRHSKNAPLRFANEAAPALLAYSNQNTQALTAGIQAARDAIVAKTDEDRLEFLGKKGFTQAQANKVIATVLAEEGKPAESIWDFVQGITAVARTAGHQDARIDMERAAGKLLSKVKA